RVQGETGGCRPQEHFMLTFDGPESLLTVELAYAGDFATVQLTHGVPISDAGSGAEALVVGPRWDAALVSLTCYLAGEALEGPVASTHNQEVLDLTGAAIDRWEQVVTESATATTEESSAARAAALEQRATHRCAGWTPLSGWCSQHRRRCSPRCSTRWRWPAGCHRRG